MSTKQTFWLAQEGKKGVISKGTIVITDKKRLTEIVEELTNIDKYIFQGCRLYPGSSRNYTEYKNDGAVIYENYGETAEYNCSHYRYEYANPRAEALKLITGNVSYGTNFMQLFKSMAKEDSSEKRAAEFAEAERIIAQMEISNLSPETARAILNRMWPNFGYYAAEGLSCTDIAIVQNYDLEVLNDIVAHSEKVGVSVSDDVKSILGYENLAKSNGKVYTLAKRANRMTR